MKSVFLYFKCILFIYFIGSYAYASVIRDSEIEEVIEQTIKPLSINAGFEDLKIILLEDKAPNAFTVGGDTIYISTGLIIEFPDPDVLRGVVAHEIGHILGQHVIRRQEIIDNYSKASLAATAVGLATAISGGAAEGIAISVAGIHIGDRSISSYSRGLESAADQRACNLLEGSGHSVIGMIKFFERSRIQTNPLFLSEYDRTHPLSKDRLLMLKSFNTRSKYRVSQNSSELQYKFRRISTKLAAYTVEADNTSNCTFKENLDELIHYEKAIKCYRIGSFDNAINHVNSLLSLKPKDPFYHELKGQIYFEADKKGIDKKVALDEYNIAIEQRPSDVLLKLGRAVIGISSYMKKPNSMAPYYKDILYVIGKEPKNLLALYYLSIYYDRMGLQGKSYLNTAKISLITDNLSNAKLMAKAAMQKFQEHSIDWYKASDVYELANLKQQNMQQK